MRVFDGAPIRALVSLLALAGESQGQRTWHPTITSVSLNVVDVGTPVTISGTDLMPFGWDARLVYKIRYGAGTGLIQLACCSATQLRFNAPDNMDEDSTVVEWIERDTAQTRQNPIPTNEQKRAVPVIVVQGPPDVTFVGDQITADVGPSFRLLSTGNGAGIIKGRYLRKLAMPTVTFAGSTQQVLQHLFEPAGSTLSLNGAGGGADRLAFTIPTQKTTGYVVVAHPLGRDSALTTLAFPPIVQELLAQVGSLQRPLAPAGVLYRGQTYIMRGTGLSITHTSGGTTSVKRGVAKLGATSISSSFASDTNLVFTVPTSTAIGSTTLSIQTPVGSATVGTFSVRDPSVPINVVSVTPPSLTSLTNRKVELTATVSIPADADKTKLGSLLFTVPASAQSVIQLPASVAVQGPQVSIPVVLKEVQVTTPITFTVAHESNGVNGQATQTQQVTITVRPPHPIGMKPEGAVVSAGRTTKLAILMDSSVKASTSTIVTLLTSSDPNVLAVPGSATLSDNGATFDAVAPVSNQDRSATITATLDGVTVSRLVTVQRPRMLSATVGGVSPATAMTKHVAEAVFDGTLSPQANVQWTTSDTTFKRVVGDDKMGLQFDGKTWREEFRVVAAAPETRQVVVTASYAGVSRSDTVTVAGLAIGTFTPTPASAPGGAQITATALLTSTPLVGMVMAFASADTTVATVSPTSSVLTNDSKVVAIQLKGPFTTTRSVAITASLKMSTGVIVSQKSTLITVTP